MKAQHPEKQGRKRKTQKHCENTAKNGGRARSLANLKPFKTGYDPRRNYHGRPHDIDQLRELVRDIGANEVELKDGQKVSRLYLKVLEMFDSRDPRDSALILTYGFGKVPDEIKVGKLSDDELVKRAADLAATLGLDSRGTSAPPVEPPGETGGGDPPTAGVSGQ